MGFFDTVSELISPSSHWERQAKSIVSETRGLVPSEAFPDSGGQSGPSSVQRHSWRKPPRRGEGDILAAYIFSPPFRAVVHRVISSACSVPFFEKDGDKKHYDAPSVALMSDYNPDFTGTQGMELEQLYAETIGEFVTLVFPVSSEKRLDLYPVPPTWVTVESEAGRRKYIVRMNGQSTEWDADNVIHYRELDPMNPYGRGRGMGWTVSDEIESDEYASKHAKAYFYNSSTPEFISTVKGATQKQAKALQAEFEDRYRGFRRSYRPVFVPWEMDIHELTRKLGDDRIDELRRSWADIVRYVYGVPPEIMGVVDSSNRATIKEARQIMGEFVTDPRCKRRLQLWNKHIMPAFGDAQIGYDSPIPREFDRRDEIMSRHPYHFTRNDIRREAGYSDVADGNVYAVPVNVEEQPAGGATSDDERSAPVVRLVAQRTEA